MLVLGTLVPEVQPQGAEGLQGKDVMLTVDVHRADGGPGYARVAQKLLCVQFALSSTCMSARQQKLHQAGHTLPGWSALMR